MALPAHQAFVVVGEQAQANRYHTPHGNIEPSRSGAKPEVVTHLFLVSVESLELPVGSKGVSHGGLTGLLTVNDDWKLKSARNFDHV